MDKEYQEIDKELDPTNPEDLLEYIQPFIYLFNKKKFEKLPERREQNYAINLLEDAPKKFKYQSLCNESQGR